MLINYIQSNRSNENIPRISFIFVDILDLLFCNILITNVMPRKYPYAAILRSARGVTDKCSIARENNARAARFFRLAE